MTDYTTQLKDEQTVVDAIYARLDSMAAQTRERLTAVRAAGGHGSPTQRTERDSFATMYEERLTQLRAVQDRLVFGRLDTDEGEKRYIGRIGLSDHQHNPMLTDWRAEAARPFYEATPKNRFDVVMRRHISLKFREVTGIEDEVLDVSSHHVAQASESGTLTGEGALLTSLSTRRTGKMTDIVATIQAEQDRIIRAPLNQVTVVQGGPGTGKTAVALHRAAYLLYTHRQRLGKSGVLVVGPSPAFLHYIDQVLPSLGETGVLSRTISTLLPGITTSSTEEPFAAQIKGDIRMAKVVSNAVAMRVRVLQDLPIVNVNGVKIRITAADIEESQQAARRSHLPHNRARVTFVERMLEALVRRYEEQLDYTPETAELARVKDDLRFSDVVKKTLNLSWLPLNAEWLIEDLWAKPEHLRRCAPWLSDEQIALLTRPKGSGWTASDIPLLDEAMELIGDDPRTIAAAARKSGASAEEKYAQETLESMGISSSLVNAKQLAAGMESGVDDDLLVARAAKDRTWTFGHVVVDEAQELTRMEWRMLIRRCPTRSFTIVGDVAQTSALGGARSWNTMLNPVFGNERWQLGELTIDYRNPQEVATLASNFARNEGLYVSTVKAVREIEGSVKRITLDRLDTLIDTTVDEIMRLSKEYLSTDGTGRIAVIADDELLSSMRAPLWDAIRDSMGTDEAHRLQSQPDNDDQIDLTNPEGIKGLEYDAVILVQPGLIEQNSPNRLTAASDLYVSLTRPTQQLVIVRTRDDNDSLPL